MALRTDLDHIVVSGLVQDHNLTRKGSGDQKIRVVEDRVGHAVALADGLHAAIAEDRRGRDSIDGELASLGVFVTIRAASADFPLKLESLDRWSQHRKTPKIPLWALLAVATDENGFETASVWIADASLEAFFKLLSDYQNEMTKPSKSFPDGHPKNDELVANMAEIRKGVARDLWTSAGEVPEGSVWWELVLRRSDAAMQVLNAVAVAFDLVVAPEVLKLDDCLVAWVEGTWENVSMLTITKVTLREIRRPSRVNRVLDLPGEDQDEYVADLVSRLPNATGNSSVTVCLLDTGVLAGHQLLAPFLGLTSLHSAVTPDGTADVQGHGTKMAGLAMYGDLQPVFESSGPVDIRHSLESVKILPDSGSNDRSIYALITSKAVALPEAAQFDRLRTFALAVTAQDQPAHGEPTTWSAAIDALAAGAAIDQSSDGVLSLLDEPDERATRLFVVSAGNVRNDPASDYLAQADLSGIEEPAQAWNVLTVGAFTELVGASLSPSFQGWSHLAEVGELSPHSRTGVSSQRQWPNKPDVVFEGGNLLIGPNGLFDDKDASISLTSTSHRGVNLIASANATSAATALAANLAANLAVRYPSAWPETIRALMVHSAEWTPAMRTRFEPASKTQRFSLLRRYGWGVPQADRALSSTSNAATLIIEDSFQPFEGVEHKSKNFRLHQLPWPREVLKSLGEEDVRLRVTLSYFIEPALASRGWRMRYSYASHGLRFELKRPLETDAAFVRRVNNAAEFDDNGEKIPGTADQANWYIGTQQRDRGSLISDIWTGTGASLADCDQIAVRPIGGWWKYNKRKDRQDRIVRYALVMSLDTKGQDVDLYTPIEIASKTAVATPIPTR